MDNAVLLALLGGGALLLMVIVFVILFRQAQGLDLDSPAEGEKPEWIASQVPEETRAATQADGEGITLYDHDPGEDLAAPFAEQIEDILRAELAKDPELSRQDVDLGTGPDGGIEFHIGGETYTSVEAIPDPRIQAALQRSIEKYNRES